MKFRPFKRKNTVTCLRNESDPSSGSFVSITDEANDWVLFQVHSKDDPAKISTWFRIEKEIVLSMIGSLWPDEVAIVTDDDD